MISVRQPATGAANIGCLNFTCLFQRAEIQVNKCKCGKLSPKTEFFPGNLFCNSCTNRNSGNYLRHGINITANQRLSPTFRGNGNTIIVGDSQTSLLPIFSEVGGTSVHRLQTSLLPIFSEVGGTSVHRLPINTFVIYRLHSFV